MIAPILAATAIVAIAGTAILLLAVGNHLSRRARLLIGARIAVALAIPSLSMGLATLMLLTRYDAPRYAALASAVTGVVAIGTQWLRARGPARLRRAMVELARGNADPDTIAALLTQLPRLKPRVKSTHPYRGIWVPLTLEAAGRLIAHGQYAHAATLCEGIPAAWLTEVQETQRDSALSVARLRMGELAAARAVLDRARVPARHADRAALEASRALLLLREGKPAEALEIAGDDRWIDGHTRVALLIVRAHAHAELGDANEAKRALALVRQAIGPQGLAAALGANPGAASAL